MFDTLCIYGLHHAVSCRNVALFLDLLTPTFVTSSTSLMLVLQVKNFGVSQGTRLVQCVSGTFAHSNTHAFVIFLIVHLQGSARQKDVKGSKETTLQRSISMYCLETGSESLVPFHVGERKLSQSMDTFPQQSPKLWSQSPLQISKLSPNPKEMELLEASRCGQLDDVNYLLMTGVNVNVATVVSGLPLVFSVSIKVSNASH